ncbi:hypothetical protein, conserved [Trypanosoma brucei gambiense DAL972]|uniref:Uncharacterized protein n=1 Tax=Trypanosoma brucei gambiense (strain MHOM/CI/86/DAL972) TaxID=679716 RepID=C9ZRJ2_TRYB9|nr:hypothetical protein, conserved [Trypanosoma brucei gambiense DAL972]CBH12294.1 hypothetical protein, conserved [Trypanosoma brucei gambiense DAL972]|eukprot:XP_011774575.1 hypothetical protein, conserved [Trypanosoma brucei gambiense DAL972]
MGQKGRMSAAPKSVGSSIIGGRSVTTMRSSLLPTLPGNFDDAMATPWPIANSNRRASEYPSSLPGLPHVATTASTAYGSNYYLDQYWDRGMPDVWQNSVVGSSDNMVLDRERSRRLMALQRRKYKELVKAEKEAFTVLMQKEEGSVESINAFTAFRISLQRKQEQYRAKNGSWLAQSFAIRVEQLIEQEQEERRMIQRAEFRVRDSRQCVERIVGAKMRFQRAIESLFRSEEQYRSIIEEWETSEARHISALRPFVTLKSVRALGQCPFVSVKDCPFHHRGEGVRSNHYRFSVRDVD